eukprot:COSAG02_NODE_60106_length_272_cov_0.601156_1_plen_64_part_01
MVVASPRVLGIGKNATLSGGGAQRCWKSKLVQSLATSPLALVLNPCEFLTSGCVAEVVARKRAT